MSGEKRRRGAYLRLLGYALHYRGRIAAMMLLSLTVGASFGSVIFTVGSAVGILFGSDADFARQAERLGGQAQGVVDRLEGTLRRAPGDVAGPHTKRLPGEADRAVREFLQGMRDDRPHALRVLSISVVIFMVLNGIARYLLEYYAASLGLNVSLRLNREMFANLTRLSGRFYDRRSAGELVSRFTNDSYMVNAGLTDVFTRALREPARGLALMFVALSVDAYLTAVVIVVISPLIIFIVLVARRVKTAVHRSLERVASVAGLLNEAVRGMSIIKIFGLESYEQRRMERGLDEVRRQRKRIARADAVVGPTIEFTIVLALCAFLLIAERRVSMGLLPATDIIQLLLALAGMLEPMRLMGRLPNLIQTSSASAARVFEFIDYPPDVVERPGAGEIPPLRESIRFEDVHFAYAPGVPVLNGASFEVPRGQMVALVGFSGAGKSTLVKLLPRFYDVDSGRICIDGVDTRDATLASLRGQIGMVTQETILFSETVARNIAAGLDAPPPDRVRAAARAAHADVFVEAMPAGYDSMLSEAGGNLSGGQRQRVAIARAIFKDAPILILDEATSSLDSESEKAILDALDHFVQGRTTLVIAHRLSTILKADKIVVLEGGRVVDEGTHAELIERDGLYRRLYRLQFAADGPADAGPK